MACLLRPGAEATGSLLYDSLQLLKLLNDLNHLLKRVFALVLQTNMRGFSEHSDAQRNRPAVRVPHNAAGRLGQKHPDAAAAQSSLRGQPRRAAFSSRLFIGNQRYTDSSGYFLP